MRKLSADEWKAGIQECYSSEISVSQWCEENKVSHKAFYYWRRRLNITTTVSSPHCDTTKRTKKLLPETKEWISLDTNASDSHKAVVHQEHCPLVITIGNTSIKINESFNPSLLAEVVKILQTLC